MLPIFRPQRAIVAAALLVMACSSESAPNRPQCPDSGPSFHLTLTSDAGALPSDTRVEVTYGAGYEVYELDDATRAGKSVLCERVPEDGSTVDALSCELWTSGAATLHVTAEGYETIDETLTAERDDCGIKLTSVARVLSREERDGG